MVLPKYLPLAYRTRTDQVAVVSSGIVGDSPDWRPLANHQVLTVDLDTREERLTAIGVSSMAGE